MTEKYVRASNRKFHFVFKTTWTITGRFYIGLHSTNNKDDGYLGSGKRLRRSIRQARIGKKHSEEAKANMRKKKDMSKNKRKCTVDGINIFDSVGDLAKALGSGKNGSNSPNFRFVN